MRQGKIGERRKEERCLEYWPGKQTSSEHFSSLIFSEGLKWQVTAPFTLLNLHDPIWPPCLCGYLGEGLF